MLRGKKKKKANYELGSKSSVDYPILWWFNWKAYKWQEETYCWCPLWQGGPIIGRSPTIWEGIKNKNYQIEKETIKPEWQE